MTSISAGGEQQIDLAILNLEETAKGSQIMFMHKYTFSDWPQNKHSPASSARSTKWRVRGRFTHFPMLRQQFLEMIHTDCSAYCMNATSLTIRIL